ncbi:Ger(x)C family spore germination protein [Paenibacillus sp. y28]|uniref:Ger(x)C family spore germination protein n=1 Tax=Paenibacillus sp. y28 TaxID=3129110 RepID=UPI003015EE14
MITRRLPVLLLICLLASCLSACWGRIESDEVEYVLGAAIDVGQNKEIILSVQTPVLEALKSKGMGGAESLEKEKTISVSGRTVTEAVRKYTEVIGRDLFWSHLKVLLISEEAARRGVEKFMDFFSSEQELRGSSRVCIVSGQAKDVLEANPDIRVIASDYLVNLIQRSKRTAYSQDVLLSDFNRTLADPLGGQPFLPIIRLFSQTEYDQKLAGIQQKQKIGGSKQSPLFLLTGSTAIFKGTKMMGLITLHDTRGLMWAKKRVSDAIITIPCRNEPGCFITLDVKRATRLDRDVDYADGKTIIRIGLGIEFNIAEKASHDIVVSRDYISYVEQQVAETVEKEIRSAFQQCVGTFHSDVFAFGNDLSDYHPGVWEQIKDQWEDEILPNADLEISVNASMRRISRTLASPWIDIGQK